MASELTSDDKKAFKFFGIESLVIILLIVVILIILSYLNVIPFKSYFSKLSGSKPSPTPTKTASKTNIYVQPTAIPGLSTTVTVVSENPSYTLTLQKKDAFISLLKSWTFFARTYVNSDNKATKPIENLIIHLAATDQPIKSQVDKDGGTVTSYKIDVSGNTVDYYVYVAPSVLSENKTPEERGGFALSATLRSLYTMTHEYLLTDDKSRENQIATVMQAEIPKQYFLINPK